MLDLDKIPDDILEDIASNMDWEEDQDIQPYLQRIRRLSPEQAFEKFCTWNGLPGWGDQLADTLDSLREAKVNES